MTRHSPRRRSFLRGEKLWWQWSDPRDLRRAIQPDISAPVTFADWLSGNDPAMNKILAYDPADAAELGKWSPNMHWRRGDKLRRKSP